MIEKETYGTTSDGKSVDRYTLKNKNGVTIQVLSMGGLITSIVVPDKNGQFDDITNGFDTLAEYERNPDSFGSLIGRCANFIPNGKFTLDGNEYQLGINRPPHHIHGGKFGFEKQVWDCHADGNQLKMSYTSADGEEGYPGTVTVNVIYELNDDNELALNYKATTDKPTIVNMTQHVYFNLAGHAAPNIYDHRLQVNADKYLPTDDQIPTGEVSDVSGTLFDLRQPVMLGDRVPKITGPPNPNGYGHNFCLGNRSDGKYLAAVVEHDGSGRRLECYTNQPGMQLYTSNFLEGMPGKGGAIYHQHSSLALETQIYPNAINNTNFPSCILRPGSVYNHKCWYKFSVNKQLVS